VLSERRWAEAGTADTAIAVAAASRRKQNFIDHPPA
jgi:hypothetical protein